MSATFFARIKPFNVKHGHLKQGFVVHNAVFDGGSKAFDGGDGIHQIPVWYEVSEVQAKELLRHRQSDTDPSSKRVFDICDDATRRKIEAQEREYRLAALTGGTAAIDAIPNVAARVMRLQATPMDPDEASIADIAAGRVPGAAPEVMAPAKEHRRSMDLSVDDVQVPGRAAAVVGLKPQPVEPEPEAEPEAELELEAVEKTEKATKKATKKAPRKRSTKK